MSAPKYTALTGYLDRIKGERQKFFDTLLLKILFLPSVQGYLQDLRTVETKISGVEKNTTMNNQP